MKMGIVLRFRYAVSSCEDVPITYNSTITHMFPFVFPDFPRYSNHPRIFPFRGNFGTANYFVLLYFRRSFARSTYYFMLLFKNLDLK